MLISLILLTIGAAISIRNDKAGFFISIGSVLIALLSLTQSTFFFGIFVVTIGLLNIFSLAAMKSQIRGVDFALTALIVLATIFVIQTNNLALVIGTFVLVSVPTYMLVMLSDDRLNLEIGIKYITFMVIATVLFIIGAILLVYSHSTSNTTLYILGYVMLVLGLGLEVGIAPLHEWVPDVFAASDPIPVSIIASIAKIVPFVVAFKLLIATANPITPTITMLSAFLAVLSMFAGNIGALTSKEPGRVLGYSTVANMGYILSTFVAIINLEFIYLAIAGALLQLFANSAGKIGFFTAIKRDGAASPITYLLALSFIGMPPLMGFWSKLFITLSLINSGYVWLAVLLVINSAISVPYYMRLARELGKSWSANIANFVGVIAVVITMVTIYPPDWFAQSVKLIMNVFGLEI